MPVSPELHDKILRRDGQCFVYRILGDKHVCRDSWGNAHKPNELGKLTLDHVHLVAGGIRGKRAPDDEQHLVAMCGKINCDGPSKEIRRAEREYLQELYKEDLSEIEAW